MTFWISVYLESGRIQSTFYYNSAMIVIKEYRYAVSTELFKNW